MKNDGIKFEVRKSNITTVNKLVFIDECGREDCACFMAFKNPKKIKMYLEAFYKPGLTVEFIIEQKDEHLKTISFEKTIINVKDYLQQ